MSKKMIILTDNIYFQCKDVKSVTTFTQVIQKGWITQSSGQQEPNYVNQYTISIMYELTDEDPQKQLNIGHPFNQLNVLLDSKKECKKELKQILRQIQKQRKDDAALQEAFEEFFEGNKKDV